MDDGARSATYDCPPDSLSFERSANVGARLQQPAPTSSPEIPAYLKDTYYWCYLHPRNVELLDREFVVRTILWQQHRKLQKLAFAEILPGHRVLQAASVYGSFAPNLAAHVGPGGSLDVVDVAEVQVRSVRRKLADYPNARVHHSNILEFQGEGYDVVCCYFLLHEVPDDYKYKIVNLLLEKVRPGGKVVFVDYHKPRWWHPLKLITSIVFDTLEPFAKGLWRHEIRELATDEDRFEWRRETIFGSLFQKAVATRKA